MATATSNLHEISDYLARALAALDPTDAAVADALVAPIRQGIADRAAARSGPDGPWAANVGRYGAEKAKRGLEVGTGLEPDQPRMLDADQLAGEVKDATARGLTLAFGVDDAVKHRGMWFQNGSEAAEDGTEQSGASQQARRNFWGLTEEDADRVVEAARDLVMRAIH